MWNMYLFAMFFFIDIQQLQSDTHIFSYYGKSLIIQMIVKLSILGKILGEQIVR